MHLGAYTERVSWRFAERKETLRSGLSFLCGCNQAIFDVILPTSPKVIARVRCLSSCSLMTALETVCQETVYLHSLRLDWN